MRVSDIGEFGLIELVQKWTNAGNATANVIGSPELSVSVDNGDDAAAITFSRAPVTELYTTDTMVDGIHFTATTTPWRDLGWKAIASNISDVAAMGGEPAVALITLGLPPDALVADIEQLYSGMLQICGEYGATIIGGDMVRSPVAFITVALTGIAAGDPMIRAAASPGHLVAVSGTVGGSAGGLRQLLSDSATKDSELIAQHRRPFPHVAAGKALVAAGVGCAMDVSDGLADDLGKLCKASGVSARIFADSVPVLPTLKNSFPDHWLDLALYGGEDYVLLFTAPPDIMDGAIVALPDGAAVIGEIVDGEPGKVTILDSTGNAIDRAGAGWDHFVN